MLDVPVERVVDGKLETLRSESDKPGMIAPYKLEFKG
jgi:hypothetical protein